MQAVLICGSRNLKGQTVRAAEAVVKGLAEAGCRTRSFFLPPMKIERCRQCDDAGWGICRTEGRCVIEDDFASLAEAIRASDAVVLASPVYFGDLCESLRAFLDRLRRTCVRAEGKQGIGGKPALGVCVAGGGGGGSASCALSLEKVLLTCGFDLMEVVPVRRQNLQAKLVALSEAGKTLAGWSTARPAQT